MAEEYDDLQKMMSVFGGGKTTRKKKPKKKKGKSLAQQWRDDEIEWSPEVQRELSIEFLEDPPEKPLERTVSPLDAPVFYAAEGTFGPWGITRPIISKIYQEAAKPKRPARIAQKDPRVLEGPVGASRQRWLSHGWKDIARTEAKKWGTNQEVKWGADLQAEYPEMNIGRHSTQRGPRYTGTYKTKHGDVESFGFLKGLPEDPWPRQVDMSFPRDQRPGITPGSKVSGALTNETTAQGYAASSRKALEDFLSQKGIEKDFVIKESRMHNSVFALPK